MKSIGQRLKEKRIQETENTYVLFYHKDGFQETHYYMPQDLEKILALTGDVMNYNDACILFLRTTTSGFAEFPEWAKEWNTKVSFNEGTVFLRGKQII